MSESNETEYEFEAESENIRVGVDKEWELPDAPYFYSPYPDRLVQVHAPETRGGREVARLINTHWPANIEELVNLSQAEFEDGYSGSFIRSVLRNNYIPEDKARLQETEENEEHDSERPEVDMPEEMPEEISGIESVDEEWHKVFRMGIRAALQNNIDEHEAFVAFESGFVEGQKLREEL